MSGSGEAAWSSGSTAGFSGDISTSMGSSSFSSGAAALSSIISIPSSPSAGVWLSSPGSSLSAGSLGQLGTGEGSPGYSWEGSGVASFSFTISTSGFLVQVFKCSQKSDHLKNSAQHFSHTWVSSLPLRLSFPLSASSRVSPGTERGEGRGGEEGGVEEEGDWVG